MNFSDFAHMIYSYDTKGLKKSEFVVFLIDQIMEEPFTEEDKQKEDDGKYNPLDKLAPNTLEKIFNGSRNISKEQARIIRSHLNKDKFDDYIANFSNYAIDCFKQILIKANMPVTGNEVSRACANTFEKILTDLVSGTPKQSSDYLKGFMDGIDFTAKSVLKRLGALPLDTPVSDVLRSMSGTSALCSSPPALISSSCKPTPMISSNCEAKKD